MDWLNIAEWTIRVLSILILVVGFLREYAKNAKTKRGLGISQDIMSGARDILKEIVSEVRGANSGITAKNMPKTDETPKVEEEPAQEETSQETPVEPPKQETPPTEEATEEAQPEVNPLVPGYAQPADKWLKGIYESALYKIQQGATAPVYEFIRDYVAQVYYKEYKEPIQGGEDSGR